MSISGVDPNPYLNTMAISLDSLKRPKDSNLYSTASEVVVDSNNYSRNDLPVDSKTSESELQQKAYLSFLEKYIRSYGAPEELDRNKVEEVKLSLEDEEDEIKKKAEQSFDPNSLDTFSKTIEDPEDDKKIKVVVSKKDEEGNVKITRVMSFGGQNSNKSENNKVARNENDPVEASGGWKDKTINNETAESHKIHDEKT